MKFKQGDRVRHKETGAEDIVVSVPGMKEYDEHGFAIPNLGMLTKHHSWELQKEWEFDSASHSYYITTDYAIPADWQSWPPFYSATVITKPSTIMKLTNLVKKLVDSDTQALIKAGFLNGDLELTSEGRRELETILFLANKPALVEAAKEAIDEKAKEAA